MSSLAMQAVKAEMAWHFWKPDRYLDDRFGADSQNTPVFKPKSVFQNSCILAQTAGPLGRLLAHTRCSLVPTEGPEST
jgi:hypothetical protein